MNSVWCVFRVSGGYKDMLRVFWTLEDAHDYVESEFAPEYPEAYWIREGEDWIYELRGDPAKEPGNYVVVEEWVPAVLEEK